MSVEIEESLYPRPHLVEKPIAYPALIYSAANFRSDNIRRVSVDTEKKWTMGFVRMEKWLNWIAIALMTAALLPVKRYTVV